MSPPTRAPKTECICLRLHREAKTAIARAAALCNQSLSDFLRSVALERAHDILDRTDALYLNEHEAERFLAALANPPEPVARLRKLAGCYRQAIAKGDLETE